ncbi:hypothetical protein [Streptomyces sp. NBC_00878]|uniref:hypothetical protein n=1 Tax=Streptomyces sp. NBC_00878 TaxID=2975854 RepID=UPI002259B3EC|nr:hypothetical protein [Streptomyces sp. NBC_00878]MCX4905834.1 hypothetical protein [Streptomyces sp. NBC_00878]
MPRPLRSTREGASRFRDRPTDIAVTGHREERSDLLPKQTPELLGHRRGRSPPQ